MLLCPWNKLPEKMRNDAVKPYYDILAKKKPQLLVKRLFDLIVASLMVIAFSPLLLVIAILIKLDSKGSIFFRQVRVTQNCREFKIFKFRTMCENAESIGTQVTTHNDNRVTRIGHFLRKYRLDEIPQLFNIITGDMTFVGTRPEVVKYVEKYQTVFLATLLLPAGVTSEASIRYKDEEKLLVEANDVDRVYVEKILTEKMRWNLESIKNFRIIHEFLIILYTFLAVL